MIAIEDNDFFSSLCKEYNIKLPNNLQNRKIYEEIENFREAEYIYCSQTSSFQYILSKLYRPPILRSFSYKTTCNSQL